jgi:hypothetical protein
MKDLPLLQQLDILLSFLISGIDNSGVIDYFNSHNREFNELLVKLAKDGYTTNTTQIDNIRHEIHMPTIEGRMFMSNGGYVRQNEINIATAEQNAFFLRRSRVNERLVARYTIIAALGAWLVLLWYIFIWFYPNHDSLRNASAPQLIKPTDDNLLTIDTSNVYRDTGKVNK